MSSSVICRRSGFENDVHLCKSEHDIDKLCSHYGSNEYILTAEDLELLKSGYSLVMDVEEFSAIIKYNG